jgi:tRNA/rRNA methyltransferase
MSAPAIVLVRPQLGQNIGMVARAMANFALTDLRLVNPRDGWPNPEAGPAAAGADDILDGVQLFDTLEAATADCHRVFGTIMAPRGMLTEVITPAEAACRARTLATDGGQTALVFGPERSGLGLEDAARCHAIISIPANPAFASLNLAMAVSVIAYAWFVADAPVPASYLHGDHHGPATQADLDGLLAHLDAELAARGYFFPDHRAPVMRRTLRGIFQRPGFTAQEVRTLRGVIRTLTDRPKGPLEA